VGFAHARRRQQCAFELHAFKIGPAKVNFLEHRAGQIFTSQVGGLQAFAFHRGLFDGG
jgi:hypothetical protein